VGTRAALLPELFAVFTKGFESIDNPNEGLDKAALKLVRRLRAEILKYARLLEAAAAGVPLVEYALLAHGVPARGLGVAVKGGVETFFAVLKGRPTSLEAQKERVVKLLRESPRRVVIVIDDVDRLEPAEAVSRPTEGRPALPLRYDGQGRGRPEF
jgi:KAP family P-loop domain